jgi:hypothetical protein
VRDILSIVNGREDKCVLVEVRDSEDEREQVNVKDKKMPQYIITIPRNCKPVNQ